MRFTNACIALAPVVVTALAFAGALRNGFVNFDDDKYAFANEHVRQGRSRKMDVGQQGQHTKHTNLTRWARTFHLSVA